MVMATVSSVSALTQEEFDKLPFCDQVGSTNTVVVAAADATPTSASIAATNAASYPTATGDQVAPEATGTGYAVSAAMPASSKSVSSFALLVVSAFAALV